MTRLDMPLIRVLGDMEDAGIGLDCGVLAAHKRPLQRQLVRLEVRVCVGGVRDPGEPTFISCCLLAQRTCHF